jgi:hypothetical protein
VCFELPPISRVQEMGGSSQVAAFLLRI